MASGERAALLPLITLPHVVGRGEAWLKEGETHAIVYLRGMITWESAYLLARQINFYVEAKAKIIDLKISSHGGDANAALMLVDLIDELKEKGTTVVRTIIDGVAASAATLVSVAGHERYIHKRGWMMIHLPSISSAGPFHANSLQLSTASENMEMMVKRMKDVYRCNLHNKASGETRTQEPTDADLKKLDKDLLRDNWISAEDCEKMHLVDHVGFP